MPSYEGKLTFLDSTIPFLPTKGILVTVIKLLTCFRKETAIVLIIRGKPRSGKVAIAFPPITLVLVYLFHLARYLLHNELP